MQSSIALKPLTIGNVEIGFPIVQAALSGYSDWPMRVIAKRMGAPYTICEVMLDQFLVSLKERKRTSHFLHISDEEHPVGGQLMGADPMQFAEASLKLVEAGFDIIDINFGCPVKKVLGRCRGGFHLGQPETALEIVQRTRHAVPDEIPVTVKMRRGIDDTAESEENFFRILDGAFQIGVSAVTVHGRTVKQRYIGPSRWEFLRKVKQHLGDKTLLGSGDLFTPEDCLRMIEETGVDGVTVARGAIGNPWIFSQARAISAGQPMPEPPSLHEQREIIREHFQLAAQVYPANRVGPIMRKFGIKYAILHPNHDEVRADFVKVRDESQWNDVLRKWYAVDLPGTHPNGKMHKAQSSSGNCSGN